MKRPGRWLAVLGFAIVLPACAEDELREPSAPGHGSTAGLIPGRVYNDAPRSASRSETDRETGPTSAVKPRTIRDEEVVVAEDPGDGAPIDTASERPREPVSMPVAADRNDRAKSGDLAQSTSPIDHEDEIELEGDAPPARLRPLEQTVLEAHNRIRAAAKLPRLEFSPRLRAAAYRQARDMARHKKMSHVGSDDSQPAERIREAGYPYRRAGENVAFGRYTVEGLMKGWMESPPHKRNILGSFSQIGVAYATATDGVRYWCVTFGIPQRR